MLAQWRLRRLGEPLHVDAEVARQDGMDYDAILATEMDAWYARLIDTADADLLAPVEVADEVELTPEGCCGAWRVRLPDGVRRVVRVRLDCWLRDAGIVTDLDSPLARRQLSPYTCGGVARPVAVVVGADLLLYSVPAEVVPRLVSLRVVHAPDSQTYSMDPLALQQIAGYNHKQ